MLGTIMGDVIGSVYERDRGKVYDFELSLPETQFTDGGRRLTRSEFLRS